MMRILIFSLFILAVIFLISKSFLNPISDNKSIPNIIHQQLDIPIRYRIGFIDPRFNLDEEQLRQILKEATDIWENAANKNYFKYDENALLTVNLIFDERQAESNYRNKTIQQFENEKLNSSIDHQHITQKSHDIANLESQIKQLKAQYSDDVIHHNHTVTRFNNSQTVKSESEIQQIESSKNSLSQQKLEIEQLIQKHNALLIELNNDVETFNYQQLSHQDAIDKYNQQFQVRIFDKGEFNGREINIYEFQSIEDLRITLAHEFGHALGLKHSQDPKALMYPVLEKQNLDSFRLTSSDLELLEKH